MLIAAAMARVEFTDLRGWEFTDVEGGWVGGTLQPEPARGGLGSRELGGAGGVGQVCQDELAGQGPPRSSCGLCVCCIAAALLWRAMVSESSCRDTAGGRVPLPPAPCFRFLLLRFLSSTHACLLPVNARESQLLAMTFVASFSSRPAQVLNTDHFETMPEELKVPKERE